MERLVIDTVEACNEFLKANRHPANGKNFRVEHLYPTSANSRRCYENLWGIYLTKSEFAWMAIWMAITSRAVLKKRQIQYFYPETFRGDFIGRVSIFNPNNAGFEILLCREAYLYLFDEKCLEGLSRLDVSGVKTSVVKEDTPMNRGFMKTTVNRRGKIYKTWIHPSRNPLVVDVDEWQIAVLNVEKLIPRTELVLTQKLIQELAKRIRWLSEEVGENYLVRQL